MEWNRANSKTCFPQCTLQENANLVKGSAKKRNGQASQSRDCIPKIPRSLQIRQICQTRNGKIKITNFDTLGFRQTGRVEQSQDKIENSDGGQDVVEELSRRGIKAGDRVDTGVVGNSRCSCNGGSEDRSDC